MININRKITADDIFRHLDGKAFRVPKGDGDELNYSGSLIKTIMDTFDVWLWMAPTYDSATHKLGAFIPVMEDGVQVGLTQEVIDLTTAEIATATAEDTKQTCDSIDRTIEDYISTRLNSAGFAMVERMVAYVPPNQKALDVSAWVENVAMQAEIRKAQVYAGVWPDGVDPADFSALVDKPWTAAQVMAEYVGLP